MAKYKITAYVGMDAPTITIDAKNSYEANKKALEFGHRQSNFGERFLKGTKVVRIPGKPKWSKK